MKFVATPAYAVLKGRRVLGLFPPGSFEGENFDKLHKRAAIGKGVTIEVRTPRNPDHHRLLFALLGKVCEGSGGAWATPEDLLSELKVRARMIDKFYERGGNVYYCFRSIGFESMSQEEFGKVYNRFVEIICSEIIPGLDAETLAEEVNAMLDRGYEGMRR